MPVAVLLDTSWMSNALCRGCPKVMFPEGETKPERAAAVERARQVCDQCPVFDECLDWALHDPVALHECVVAGMTDDELAVARRQVEQSRRDNYRPRCGGPSAYAAHLARGEVCAFCADRHARRSSVNGEAC